MPADSKYGRFTGVKSIYAVNMFAFLRDLGEDYQDTLASAVSRSVMEVAQHSGDHRDRSLAIPALAAAHHVRDKELVLSYGDSFSAILDGLGRVHGHPPPQVHLIIWWQINGHKEMAAALSGLESALYRGVPGWSQRLRGMIIGALAVSFVLGILWSLYLRDRLQFRRQAPRFIVLALATFGTAVGASYVEWSADILQAATFPRAAVGVAAFCGLILGALVERFVPGVAGVEPRNETSG